MNDHRFRNCLNFKDQHRTQHVYEVRHPMHDLCHKHRDSVHPSAKATPEIPGRGHPLRSFPRSPGLPVCQQRYSTEREQLSPNPHEMGWDPGRVASSPDRQFSYHPLTGTGSGRRKPPSETHVVRLEPENTKDTTGRNELPWCQRTLIYQG